jgi:hypothetical protein
MKIKHILFLFSFCIITSCEKNLTKPEINIVGQWNWVYSNYLYIDPLTPDNTGIKEVVVFKSDFTWSKTQNDIMIDSGRFSIGQGQYKPIIDLPPIIYDSIAYYKNGQVLNGKQDYFKIYNDTLMFSDGFAGFRKETEFPYLIAKYFKKLE